MKYFTPELYLKFNSLDDNMADKADQEWDLATDAYKERLEQIRKHMPPAVIKLSELCLHDASVTRDDAGPVFFIKLREQIISLSYSLDGSMITRDAPEGWTYSSQPERWLYDEVDMDGPFVHRVLLSSGVSLDIPFISVTIKE